MFIDRRQSFRAAEPVTAAFAPVRPGMPRAALGIHRLGGGPVEPATFPRVQEERAGVSGGAMIETAGGWRQASELRRGMLLHTLDGGLRPLAEVAVQAVWPMGEGSGELVHVPGGTLGACDDLWLMPDQPVLIGAPVVQEVMGLPHVQVAARSLAANGGCRIGRPGKAIQIVTLRFSRPEAIWVNSGLIACCDGTEPGAGGVAPQLCTDRASDLMGLLAGLSRCPGQACAYA